MAFSDLERKRHERELDQFLQRVRPPPELRAQLDTAYKIEGQSVEILEVRPDWQDASKTLHRPFAKATYVRRQEHWKVFWQRRDLKWHGYQPVPNVASLEAFLKVVERDEHCCFFG